MSLGTTSSPTVPMRAGGLQVTNFDHTHSNVYWDVCRHFREDFFSWGRDLGEEVRRGKLSMEEFVTGKENFHEGGASFLKHFLKEQ